MRSLPLRKTAWLAGLAMASSLLVPVVLPRLVTQTWGREGLALYLFLQAWFGLLGLADMGIQTYVAREAVAAVARSDWSQAQKLLNTGTHWLKLTMGLAVAAASLYSFLLAKLPADLTTYATSSSHLRAAVLIQIAMAGWVTYAGGRATLMEFASGKDAWPTFYAVGQALLQVTILGATLVTQPAPLWAFNGLALGLAIWASVRLGRAQGVWKQLCTASTAQRIEKHEFFQGLAGSLGLMLGQGLLVSVLPLVLTQRAPLLATLALPARTLGNMAGKFPAILNTLIWPALTRKLTTLSGPARETYAFGIFLVLLGLQLGAAAGLGWLGPWVFGLWLPPMASELPPLLPALLLEQCAVSVAAPLNLLLYVHGHLRAVAWAMVASGVFALAWMGLAAELQPQSLSNASAVAVGVFQLAIMGLAAWKEVFHARRLSVFLISALPLAVAVVGRLNWMSMPRVSFILALWGALAALWGARLLKASSGTSAL